MLPNAYAAGRLDALEKFAILDNRATLMQAMQRAQGAGRTGLVNKLQDRAMFGSPAEKQRRVMGLADKYTQEVQARMAAREAGQGRLPQITPAIGGTQSMRAPLSGAENTLVRSSPASQHAPTLVGPAPLPGDVRPQIPLGASDSSYNAAWAAQRDRQATRPNIRPLPR